MSFQLHLCGGIVDDIAVECVPVAVGHVDQGFDVLCDKIFAAFLVLADGI